MSNKKYPQLKILDKTILPIGLFVFFATAILIATMLLPGSASALNAAQTACKDAQQHASAYAACQTGYNAGASGGNKSDACTQNGTDKRICEAGFALGVKAGGASADIATNACKDTFSKLRDSSLAACVTGYNAGANSSNQDATCKNFDNIATKTACAGGFALGQKAGPSGGSSSTSGGDGSGGNGSANSSANDPKSKGYNPPTNGQCGSGDGAVHTSINIGCTGKGNPVLDFAFAIIRFLSNGAGLILIGSLIWGGIQYSTSQGDPQAIGAAKNRIKSTLTALIIFIFAYAILNYLIPGNVLK